MHPLRLLAAAAILVTTFAGCRPDYPNCETDKDCAQKKEFCVAGKCQQCRAAADCPKGFSCNQGRCDKIPGYCENRSQCPAGTDCIANRCRACTADRDCPAGSKCSNGVCEPRKRCKSDDDCAQDEDCINGFCTSGRAAKPAPTECQLASVYFDFNEAALTTEATSVLARDAECLKKVNRPVTLVGRTDPRGTAEYNIALSERRANSTRAHLERLGVAPARMAILPRGALDAKGTDEPSWAQDRRVDFTWR